MAFSIGDRVRINQTIGIHKQYQEGVVVRLPQDGHGYYVQMDDDPDDREPLNVLAPEIEAVEGQQEDR